MRNTQNSVIDLDSLKSKFFGLTICLLMKYGQNKGVKIWLFQPQKAEIENWSNWKNKTIFLTSSSSWFQICKKIWKKFIFWRFFAKKTCKRSRNLSKFLFKKVALMCMLLHLSFKKIVRFVFKLVIWPLEANTAFVLNCPQLSNRLWDPWGKTFQMIYVLLRNPTRTYAFFATEKKLILHCSFRGLSQIFAILAG